MTPSQHGPLIPWATHVLQSHLQKDAKPIKGGANPLKDAPVRIEVCNSTS